MSKHNTSVDSYLLRDLAKLRNRVTQVEAENKALRESLWELSWRIDPKYMNEYFDIPALDDAMKINSTNASEQNDADSMTDVSETEDISKMGIDDRTHRTGNAVDPGESGTEGTNDIQNPISQITPRMRQVPQRQMNGANGANVNKRVDEHSPVMTKGGHEATPVTALSVGQSDVNNDTQETGTQPHNTTYSHTPLQNSRAPSPEMGMTSQETANQTTSSHALNNRENILTNSSSNATCEVSNAMVEKQGNSQVPSVEDRDGSSSTAANANPHALGSSSNLPIIKKDFTLHGGPIYKIQFAPTPISKDQHIMASAGLDGIYLWGSYRDKQEFDWSKLRTLVHLAGHTGPVADIAFSSNSRYILSGGFDGMVKVTDVVDSIKHVGMFFETKEDDTVEDTKLDNKGITSPNPKHNSKSKSKKDDDQENDKQSIVHGSSSEDRSSQQQTNSLQSETQSYLSTNLPFVASPPYPKSNVNTTKSYSGSLWSTASEGLVLAVTWIPPSQSAEASTGNLFAWGTSGKIVCIGDLTKEKPIMVIEMPSVVNTLSPFNTSPYLYAGDANGSISIISLELGRVVSSFSTPNARPISYLSLPTLDAQEPRWLAQVSYDNTTRVYERQVISADANAPSNQSQQIPPEPKLVFSLKGHNRNWPVKCAWLENQELALSYSQQSRGRKVTNSTAESPLLLATGSSNGYVFVHDAAELLRGQNSSLVQIPTKQIAAHQGAVCAVDMIRSGKNVWLASGGQDAVITLWRL